MPGAAAAVCLRRNGGLVELVGDVTAVVVNLEPAEALGGGRDSDTLDVAFDFWSIFSELDFADDDGLDAFDGKLSDLSWDSWLVIFVFSLSAVFELSFVLAGKNQSKKKKININIPIELVQTKPTLYYSWLKKNNILNRGQIKIIIFSRDFLNFLRKLNDTRKEKIKK